MHNQQLDGFARPMGTADATAGQPPLSFHPLIVLRRGTRWPSIEAANRSAQYREQYLAIALWAQDRSQALLPPIFILRSQRQYQAAADQRLLQAIDKAKRNRTMLLISDFMRLIDCRSDKLASEGLVGLLRLEPPIYSIADGLPIASIPWERLQSRIYAGRLSAAERSQRAKDAHARNDSTDKGPTKLAARAGANARKTIADRRAIKLVAEIERVRLGLPKDRQQNLAALAKALNDAGVPTASGRGQWQGSMVGRALARAQKQRRSSASAPEAQVQSG